MKNLHIWLTVLTSLLFQSCIPTFSPSQKIKRDFTFCYDGKDSGIDQKLNIEGYFVLKGIRVREKSHKAAVNDKNVVQVWQPSIDTSFTNIMFYNDGTVSFGFHNYAGDIPSYFREIVHKNKKGERDYFYTHPYWGLYKLSGDTIKIQAINHPAPFARPWIMRTPTYIIKDRNTIEYLEMKETDPEMIKKISEYNKELGIIEERYLPATLIPTSERPTNENAWLLNKKWFRCK